MVERCSLRPCEDGAASDPSSPGWRQRVGRWSFFSLPPNYCDRSDFFLTSHFLQISVRAPDSGLLRDAKKEARKQKPMSRGSSLLISTPRCFLLRSHLAGSGAGSL